MPALIIGGVWLAISQRIAGACFRVIYATAVAVLLCVSANSADIAIFLAMKTLYDPTAGVVALDHLYIVFYHHAIDYQAIRLLYAVNLDD